MKRKTTKTHIKANDQVKVIAGNHKGKIGKVIAVYPKVQRAKVEGVNLLTHYIKPNQKQPRGGIEKKEVALHISNLMLLLPGTEQTTRVGRKRDEKGKLQRQAKKTGKFI